MLKNDKFNLVIALLLAIGLWAYVVGMENPEKDIQIKDVPISFVNAEMLEADGLTILSVSDKTVNVVVSGHRSDIKDVKKDDIKITADLDGYKEGEHTVRLQIGRINNVEIESKQKITIVVDQLISQEKPVSVSMAGDVQDEAEPYIMQVHPLTVTVTGAKTLVDSVVKVDAPLDIEKVGLALKSFTVALKPVNAAGETVEKVMLNTGSVSVSAVNLSKKTVPLEVPIVGQNLGDAQRLLTVPKTITIKGLGTQLSEIQKITAETIDISNIYEDVEIDVIPILPEGVEAASNSQDLYVGVAVNGMKTKSFEYGKDAVIIEGIDENMTVVVEDVKIKLTAVGKEAVMETLEASDFSFETNVSHLTPGTYEVALHCSCEKDLSRIEFTPQKVTVTITELTADSEEQTQDGEENENGEADAEEPDTEAGAEAGTDGETESESEAEAENGGTV